MGGSLVLVGAVIVTVVSVYLFFNWKTKQRVKNFQKDILYVHGDYMPIQNLLLLSKFFPCRPGNTGSIAGNDRATIELDMSSHLTNGETSNPNPYGQSYTFQHELCLLPFCLKSS